MSDRSWWVVALQWTLWALVMTAVMGWLGRARMKARPATEARTLRQPVGLLVLGVVCVGLFGAAAVATVVTSTEPGTWSVAFAFVCLAMLGVPLLLDYFVARHEVSEEGLTYRKYSGARRFMRWSEVRSVRLATQMKWFRLEDTHGQVARLSFMLMGLPEFARLLLRYAPDGVLEPAMKTVLRETAAGNPPAVWG